MKNYREQDGCHNCTRVFVRHEYDSENELFCRLGASLRPPCGSVAMNESHSANMFDSKGRQIRTHLQTRAEFSRRSRAWERWAKGRKVKEQGVCDAHIKRKEPSNAK